VASDYLYVKGGFRGGILIPRALRHWWSCSPDLLRASRTAQVASDYLYVKGGFRGGILIPPRP
jgi:hypothetical protein